MSKPYIYPQHIRLIYTFSCSEIPQLVIASKVSLTLPNPYDISLLSLSP